jgi:ribosome-binding protein aMBF1 (putative translation factor)
MQTILGTDDAVNTCDCCGKTNLKFTFAVDVDGEVLHYGSVCVRKWTGKTASQANKEAKDAMRARREAAKREVREHPTYAAYRARMEEARSRGLLSIQFMEFCRAEREAQEAAQMEIAKRAGFKFYELHA